MNIVRNNYNNIFYNKYKITVPCVLLRDDQ